MKSESKSAFMGISELSGRSGVSIPTIKFYLRQGLLTRPQKTSRTMAYYTAGHLEELALIKKLRKDEKLSLADIKDRLKRMPAENAENPAARSVEFSVREARIIDGAFRLFSGKGYEKVTIGEIAEAARISKSTFYLHFGNKKELFHRCFQSMLKGFVTESVLSIGAGADIAEILRKIPEPFFREYAHWNAMASQLRAASVYDPENFGDRFEEVLEMFVEPVRAVMESREVRKQLKKINARLLAVMLLGAVDYAAYYLMRGKISGNPGKILEQGLEMVLHGILKK